MEDGSGSAVGERQRFGSMSRMPTPIRGNAVSTELRYSTWQPGNAFLVDPAAEDAARSHDFQN